MKKKEPSIVWWESQDPQHHYPEVEGPFWETKQEARPEKREPALVQRVSQKETLTNAALKYIKEKRDLKENGRPTK